MEYPYRRYAVFLICVAFCLFPLQTYADERQTMSQESKTTHTIPLYARATDFESVESLDEAIAKIGDDGNIGPLLMQMAHNNVIIPVLVDEEFAEEENVPFDPLILGDETFAYIPFFDGEEAYESWEEGLDEELAAEIAAIIMPGALFFPVISESQFHVVLNPHLDQREVIYHDNLVWLRHKVDALDTAISNGIDHLNVVVNTSQSLPPNAKRDELLKDLTDFVTDKPVAKAYLFMNDAYDQRNDTSARTILIMIVPESDELSDAEINQMTQDFGFTAEKYDFENDVSLGFANTSNTEASKALLENSQPFYNKEK